MEVKLPEAAELETGFNAKIEIGHLKSGEKKEVRWRFKIKPAAQGSDADAKAAPTAATKAAPLEAVGTEKAQGAARAESANEPERSLKPGESGPLQVEAGIYSTRGGVEKKEVKITTQ